MRQHAWAWIVFFATATALFVGLAPRAAREDVLLRRYRALLDADGLVQRYFVDPPPAGALVEPAVRGALSSLDPYSSYLSPAEYAAFRRRLAGEDVGVGLELGRLHGQTVIIAPRPESSAGASDVQAGDVILAVDEENAELLSLASIELRLSGPPGSDVKLTVFRPSDDSTHVVTLQRRADVGATVLGLAGEGWWIDEGARLAGVRITAFRESTSGEMAKVLAELRAAGCRGLLLDLRNNPGGLIESAVGVLKLFIADGELVATLSQTGARERIAARGEPADVTLPLVVLINEGTASAAEIVAGSLQDHGRATIVGTRSFGKGSVQYVLPLANDQGAVRLTSAYYQLPKGRIVHRTPQREALGVWGIQPDVLVPDAGPTAAEAVWGRGLEVLREKPAGSK